MASLEGDAEPAFSTELFPAPRYVLPTVSVTLDIALGANISRASLYRLFDTQARSVHGTLREQRLQKGLSYLEESRCTGLSIGAIAHACGFSDQAVFSKLFRQRFGVTPRQARSASAAQQQSPREGLQFR